VEQPNIDDHREGGPSMGILFSLESQLVSLYAERDELERRIGVSDAADVIALVEHLRRDVATAHAQISTQAPEPPASPTEPASDHPAGNVNPPEVPMTALAAPTSPAAHLAPAMAEAAMVARHVACLRLLDNLNGLVTAVPLEHADLTGCSAEVVASFHALETRLATIMQLISATADLMREQAR
jgi:hypothetical protein